MSEQLMKLRLSLKKNDVFQSRTEHKFAGTLTTICGINGDNNKVKGVYCKKMEGDESGVTGEEENDCDCAWRNVIIKREHIGKIYIALSHTHSVALTHILKINLSSIC